ncbi:hypothetical protein HDU76_003099 [Blyttiomyces sp. JEL0837]|nr:hypothetical protein HDU76_003099 [Blyttiomyces sp. JEL0837]
MAILADACVDISEALSTLSMSPNFVDRGVHILTLLLKQILQYLNQTFGDSSTGSKASVVASFFNSPAIEIELNRYRTTHGQNSSLQLGITTWNSNLISDIQSELRKITCGIDDLSSGVKDVSANTKDLSADVNDISVDMKEVMSRLKEYSDKMDLLCAALLGTTVKPQDVELEQNNMINIFMQIREDVKSLRSDAGHDGVAIDQSVLDEIESSNRIKTAKVVGEQIMNRVAAWMLPENACTWDMPLSGYPDVRGTLQAWEDEGSLEDPEEELHDYYVDLWDVITMCVKREPSHGPDMAAVLKKLDVINQRIEFLRSSSSLRNS